MFPKNCLARNQKITVTLERPYPPTNFPYNIFSHFLFFQVKIVETSFAKKCQRMTNATSQNWS